MPNPEQQARREAIGKLVNIAMLEGVVLIAVVVVYLSTGAVIYLIGGVLGTLAIFVPFYIRWARAHAAALKVKPNSVEEERS